MSSVDRLYSRPVESKRTGAIYNSFSYPTKIDAEAIALFIATHTKPFQTVLDVFGGSGSTGIAAMLCDKPTERMVRMARELRLTPSWGPRHAVVYELSPIGALLAEVMCKPPKPAEFARAATALVDEAEAEFGWAYEILDDDGQTGKLRYAIWSEVLLTPCCRARITLWDAAVELDPAQVRESFPCPGCGAGTRVTDCERTLNNTPDQLTNEVLTQRERVLARIYGLSGKRAWSRAPTEEDRQKLMEVNSRSSPPFPTLKLGLGDLYRAGYHTGIKMVYHLYTPRNLRAFATLWARVEHQPERLRDALRLLLLSYNATHSTLLTRVVAKKNQRDLVVSGAQSGVLYISGLPVEKNVFDGVRRKIITFREAFSLTLESRSDVRVICGSSTKLDLADSSVDYVFTDPPFGDFIPYAEVNQVNEAWLGRLTNNSEEVIVSRAQHKGIDDYQSLMSQVFAEVSRVLRPSGRATVVFHASSASIWKAVGDTFRENNLSIERTSVLDKVQVSFKQVVSEGGTRGDAVFLLRPSSSRPEASSSTGLNLDSFVNELIARADGNDDELAPRRLYSRYVARCLEVKVPVAISAPAFYTWVAGYVQELHGRMEAT